MLSFELSVIDIVLAIAVVILLTFQVKGRPPKKPAQELEMLRESRKPLGESRRDDLMPKTSRTESASHTRLKEELRACQHHFGYLETIPNRNSIPEDCYSCSRMMQCLFSNE